MVLQNNHQQRSIAKSVGCAHTTIYYELKRGTPPRKSNRGRIPGYTAKCGQEAYAANRKRSKRPCKIARDDCEPFIQWMCERIRKDRWSMDGCIGAARLMKSFPEGTIPCTKTLYNMLWANKLPLSLFDLPHALGRTSGIMASCGITSPKGHRSNATVMKLF